MGRATRLARARRAARGFEFRALGPAIRRALLFAGFGAAIGGVLLAVGVVRVALALLAGDQVGLTDAGVGALFYVLGFAAAGALVGMLWPLRQQPGGPYALAVLGAMLVFAFLARASNGPVRGWGRSEYSGILVLGAGFGLLLGHRLRRP